MENNDIEQMFCTRLKLQHESGDILYPAKMKNRDTGVIAFRLSNRGNTKADSIDIDDEQTMIDLVLNQGYGVRARTLLTPNSKTGGNSKKRAGLVRINERAIISYQLD